MAGNVITAEMVEELIIDGCDVVKCGIGPGSVCTTRLMTGVGMPQLSGVIECADAAHGVGGHIIADGGCTVPGDIAKAFGGGSDFVMLGGMLAGTDESEAQIHDGKVTFYGMSSDQAMETHGGRHSYRGSEGKVVSVPYKGAVETVITDYLGGLRSTCTYVGAKKIEGYSQVHHICTGTQSSEYSVWRWQIKHFTVGHKLKRCLCSLLSWLSQNYTHTSLDYQEVAVFLQPSCRTT